MEDYEIYYLQNLSRYIASFNIYILIIFLIFNRSYLTNAYFNILIIVLLMIANISNYYQFIPRVLIDGRVYEEPTEGEINAANYISSYIDENSKILIITDSISAARSNYLTFYKYDIISSSIYSNAYYNNSEIPISKLIEEIKGYDYVLFNIEQDKDFNILNDSIKEYTNCDAIYNYFVYEVLKDDNKFMYLLT